MAKRTPPPPGPPDSTADLVNKARVGDRSAENEIVRRHLPPLRQWARGRLPPNARDLGDTEDLVQETMIRTLNRLGSFDTSRPGGLQAYLRTAFKHKVVDQVRRVKPRPSSTTLDDIADVAPGPLTTVETKETRDRFHAALKRLSPRDNAMVSAWIDRDWDYAKIARALGMPTPNAARVAVHRACKRVWKEMNGEDVPPLRRKRQARRPGP